MVSRSIKPRYVHTYAYINPVVGVPHPENSSHQPNSNSCKPTAPLFTLNPQGGALSCEAALIVL